MAHTQKQIDKLKAMIGQLGTLVEQRVCEAITAVHQRDAAAARAVIDGDSEIDALEVDVEEECLKTLALHQPVAFDLRYVISVLKINNELERMGDLAVNIAEQALFLSQEPPIAAVPFDLPQMGAQVQEMTRRALAALIDVNPDEAQAVRELDDGVDEIHRGMFDRVEEAIRNNTGELEQMLHLLSVSRQLERIADHASNISKDVLYLARGEIVRHRKARLLRQETLRQNQN